MKKEKQDKPIATKRLQNSKKLYCSCCRYKMCVCSSSSKIEWLQDTNSRVQIIFNFIRNVNRLLMVALAAAVACQSSTRDVQIIS